jgi:hypothetical protein
MAKRRTDRNNLISWGVIIGLAAIAFIGYNHRVSSLKETDTTKGTVIMHTRSHGRAISRPQIVCRVVINGDERLINYDTKALSISIGDCVLIRYSTRDSKITELLYDAGTVPCD